MPRLKINFSDLEAAFDDHSGMVAYYLDKETGEIVFITSETRSELDSIFESYLDEQGGAIDWETAFQEEGYEDWQQEDMKNAYQVKQGLGSRYIEVPALPSQEGFSDMEEFIDTVPDLRLQQRLERALRERHPFRGFKMALDYYPAERKRWFQFKNDRMHQRAVDWLQSVGVELDEED